VTVIIGNNNNNNKMLYYIIFYRDVYMANAIAEFNSDGSNIVSGGKSIVSVVGMMHLDGIERTLINNNGYQLVVNQNCTAVEGEELEMSKARGYDAFDFPIIS
jgi:pheromone shutdown protein TraB